jgi:DNA-directed RNA polymerase subunit E'/Rpb7
MHMTKVIETTIDLFNPKEIYTSNIPEMLIQKLKTRYSNKCYQSMLITDIIRIIKHSDIRMVDNRLDGAAYIDVQFEAVGIILVQNEILHGCKVTEVISNNSVIIEHKQAGGLIQADPKNQIIKIIKKAQLIPVIIKDVRYNINQSEISIRAIPFVPIVTPNIYFNITNGITEQEQEKLSLLLTDYNAELTLHETIVSEKSYSVFKDLIYPFKTLQKYETSNIGLKFKPLSIDEKSLSEISNGCLVAPIEASKNDDGFVFHSKVVPSELKKNVVSSSLYSALADIINRRILYLMGLRGFTEQYNTPEKFQDLMVYWKVCASLKE